MELARVVLVTNKATPSSSSYRMNLLATLLHFSFLEINQSKRKCVSYPLSYTTIGEGGKESEGRSDKQYLQGKGSPRSKSKDETLHFRESKIRHDVIKPNRFALF